MTVVLLLSAVVAMFIAWAAGTSLGVVARWMRLLTRPGKRSSTALRAAFVLAPGIVGLLAFVVILVPNPLAACHCTIHGLHHPHLCIRHPTLAGRLLAPALVLVALWTAITFWRLVPIIREVVGAERWVSGLRRLPAQRVDGIAVRVVEDLALGAFTVGVLKPIVVVDGTLWQRLSAEERRAVVHHENAHAERGDALTLAVLRMASALTLWPWKNQGVRAWKAASEVVCDRHAAQTLGDPGTVAAALVSVERIRATFRPRRLAPALGVAAGIHLEGRVRALLDADQVQSAPLVSDLVAVGIVLLGLTTFALVWPGGSFHHIVESLLGHVVQ